jgi:hypothetical protein
MSDFVPITPGVGADIATDLIAGKQHQRVKVQFGADGTATDVSADDPMPVDAAGVNQILLSLANIANILESNTIVDANQRQRITLDAITSNLALASVTQVNSIVNPLPNLPTVAGMDREMYINIAEQSYAMNILPFLKFA